MREAVLRSNHVGMYIQLALWQSKLKVISYIENYTTLSYQQKFGSGYSQTYKRIQLWCGALSIIEVWYIAAVDKAITFDLQYVHE